MSEAEIDDDSASSRKLTQEEVNALISGLDDQADPSTPAVVAREAEVSDYQFGYKRVRFVNAENGKEHARNALWAVIRVPMTR